MSVVEAMQLGLVPVVTPAGEIQHYCRHNVNSVIIEDDDRAVEDVARLIDNTSDYSALRAAAIAQWQHARLYRESILEAATELVAELTTRSG